MAERATSRSDGDVELLERRVAERTRELATLLTVSRTVASTLDPGALLGLILDELKVVVDYGMSALNTIEGDDLVQREYRGPRREGTIGLRTPIANFERTGIWALLRRGEPIIIADMAGESAPAQAWRAAIPAERRAGAHPEYHSRMLVPMLVNERLIGVIVLVHAGVDYYTPHHAELALAVARQAAVAVDNARLSEESRAYAVLQERARLARELHDSVTQNLFSMTLYAATTLQQLERAGAGPADPVRRNVQTLGELAQGALAEMRMLILELRPGALADEGLIGALRKLAASVSTREGLVITVAAPDERLPLDAKAEEELYRLTQEAVNNIVKHARASRVTIAIARGEAYGGLLLEIADDGIGFDTGAAYPGHIGLGTMAERCERAGGVLSIRSAPGAGTVVRAIVRPASDPAPAPGVIPDSP